MDVSHVFDAWANASQRRALVECAQAQCRMSQCFDAFFERGRTMIRDARHPWLQHVSHAKMRRARQALLAACHEVAEAGMRQHAAREEEGVPPVAPEPTPAPSSSRQSRPRPRARIAPRAMAGLFDQSNAPPPPNVFRVSVERHVAAMVNVLNDVFVVEPIPASMTDAGAGADALISTWFTDVLLHGLQQGLVHCAAHHDTLVTRNFLDKNPRYARVSAHEDAIRRDMAARWREKAPEYLDTVEGVMVAAPHTDLVTFQMNCMHNLPLDANGYGDTALPQVAKIPRPLNLALTNKSPSFLHPSHATVSRAIRARVRCPMMRIVSPTFAMASPTASQWARALDWQRPC
jgi:hypothetical protein